MTLLEQAQAIIAKDELTIDDGKALEQIEREAKGEDKVQIGELWEAVYASADEALLLWLSTMDE